MCLTMRMSPAPWLGHSAGESPGHEIDLVCDYRRGDAVCSSSTPANVVEEAAKLAAAVLVRCTDLQVLTTTREPLLTPGEQIVP